jgi:hypothetical protein
MTSAQTRPGFSGVLACLSLVLCTTAYAVEVRLEREAPGEVDVLLEVDPSGAQVIQREGQPPEVAVEGFDGAIAGTEPALLVPVRTFWVGVPAEGEVEATAETIERSPFQAEAVARAGLRLESLGTRAVEVGPPTWLRHQRVVPLLFRPLVQGSSGAEWARSVRVRVRFDGAAGAAGSRAASEGPDWEAAYQALIVNYDQARAFRRERVAPRPRRNGDSYSTSPEWLRIGVEKAGLYQVTGSELQAAGIDLAAIPADAVRVFTGSLLSLPESVPYEQLPAWLQEVSIRREGLEDGSFDPQDRLVFYGIGPDGFYAEFGVPDGAFERYRTDEYSNVNHYWLGWGSFTGTPSEWGEVDGRVVPEPARTTAPHRLHFEENRIWDPHPWEPPPDGNRDSVAAWEKWHWAELIATQSNFRARLDFETPDPAPGGTADLRVRLWGANRPQRSLLFPDHLVRVDIDGDSLAGAGWQERTHVDVSARGFPLQGSAHELGLIAPYRADSAVNRNDRSYLAWFEIDYVRSLVARGDSLDFLVEPGEEPVGYEVTGIADPSRILILDVTDPHRVSRIEPAIEGGAGNASARFAVDPDAGRERRIAVRSAAGARTPEIERDTAPAGGYLRERTEPVDYIILTHASLWEAAQRLAARRAQGPDGLTVAVVDVQDVYDEFSAGRLDPGAIRNFLHFAFDHWNAGHPEEAPAYVVLVGDASYDFRNRSRQGVPLTLPTYEGYYDPALLRTIYSPQIASDDWFVLFDPEPDPGLDMFLGRLVADTPATAEVLIDKIVSYESQEDTGSWRQRFTTVADDACQGFNRDGLAFTHIRQTMELEDRVLPEAFQRDRIYLTEFGGVECVFDRKPDATAALRASIDRGTLCVNYTGHGSEEQLADERVLETPGVAGMSNADRLFFFLTASCSVGKFDFGGEGLGEALVREPDGGAIGVFSASAVAFSGSNAALNQAFWRAAYPNGDALAGKPMGVVALVGKQTAELGNRRYPLLCEPLVRLSRPSLHVALAVSAEPLGAPEAPDSIYRGTPLAIRGEIRDGDGVAEDFTGTVEIEVYDSEIQRHLEERYSSITYNMGGAAIFRGSVAVSAGRFETRLLVPASLRNGDRGRAQVYAYGSSQDGRTAMGGADSLVVADNAPPEYSDQEGPAIELLPQGDPERMEVGSVWEASLDDSSGINITQLVPSRSVLLRIEEGARLVYVEDLAARVSFPESYRTGRLSFSLPAVLEAGHKYRMVLGAYDNLDNGGSVSREFTLSGGGTGAFALARVYNVPNPLDGGGTTFFLEMNQPAEVEVRIYSASGARIREIQAGTVSPATGRDRGIDWDGRDADGDPLANGVYFYKVRAKSTDGRGEERIERLAVVR